MIHQCVVYKLSHWKPDERGLYRCECVYTHTNTQESFRYQ